MKNDTSLLGKLFITHINHRIQKIRSYGLPAKIFFAVLSTLLLFENQTSAGPALGAHTVAFFPCNSTGGLSAPAIATQASGSTIIAWVGRGDTNGFTAVPTDNKTNSYALLGSMHTYSPLFPGSGEAVYAVPSATGGNGQIVSAAMPEGGDEITLAVVEIKNGGILQDAQWNKVLSPPQTSLNVTTTGPATLVAIWAGDSGANSVTATPNNGFTNINSQLLSSCEVEVVVATKDVTNAGTYNVTWTATPSQGAHMWLIAVQSAPPALTAQNLNGDLIINWPASATNYSLETSDDLSASNSWTSVTNSPAIIGSQNVLTNTISLPNQFFRLKKQ